MGGSCRFKTPWVLKVSYVHTQICYPFRFRLKIMVNSFSVQPFKIKSYTYIIINTYMASTSKFCPIYDKVRPQRCKLLEVVILCWQP